MSQPTASQSVNSFSTAIKSLQSQLQSQLQSTWPAQSQLNTQPQTQAYTMSGLGYTPISLATGTYWTTSSGSSFGIGEPMVLTRKQKTTRSLHKWLKDNLVPKKT